MIVQSKSSSESIAVSISILFTTPPKAYLRYPKSNVSVNNDQAKRHDRDLHKSYQLDPVRLTCTSCCLCCPELHVEAGIDETMRPKHPRIEA
mmetsp:Transcript_5461/g.12116  ORF Transcript_5461/g.12116 Transcript_5461/m.12116 type:complete len:92 (-) Transcript_5461:847-1122(-)